MNPATPNVGESMSLAQYTERLREDQTKELVAAMKSFDVSEAAGAHHLLNIMLSETGVVPKWDFLDITLDGITSRITRANFGDLFDGPQLKNGDFLISVRSCEILQVLHLHFFDLTGNPNHLARADFWSRKLREEPRDHTDEIVK